MKRILGLAMLSFGALALYGCPVYSGPGGGGGNGCYDYGYGCPGPSSCQSNYDCPSGSSCDLSTGTCSQACPGGYVLSGGTLQCISSDGGVDSGAADATTRDSGTADATSDATSDATADASSDTTSPTDGGVDSSFSGCTNNAECVAMAGDGGGTGAQCLDGVCYSAANQCSDSTQCTGTQQCVQGVCTPTCSSTISCPTGYSCDTQNMVCSGNSAPCGGADGGAAACSAGTTCVQEHCVAPCAEGGTCSGGLVCVDGGCMPNQQPTFVCSVDGQQDSCAAGSICLHHNCYISCNPEAGASACMDADQFNICKQVSTSTGTYNVCGSSANLGNQCDPTQGMNCPNGAVCIDGYCR
jgi:hypothetical protein